MMSNVEEEIIVEDVIDHDFSVDVCTCGICRECIKREIMNQEILECTCTYKDEVIQQPSFDEEGNEITVEVTVKVIDVQCDRCKEIDRLKAILDKYDILENAYIDESLWQECVIREGMIFTSQEALDSYLNPAEKETTLDERVIVLEEQAEMQSLMMDDLLFEVIPNLEAQIDTSSSTTQKAALLKITESTAKTIIKNIDGRVSGMAGYLAQKIMDGRDYATIFKTRAYKPYQEEVDAILEMEGYGDLIVR